MNGTAWSATGAALAGLGVILGAFGAHGLRSRVGADLLAIFETGVRYQMYHALALLALGLAVARGEGSAWHQAAGWAFLVGIAIFSGSLYALTLTGQRWLGAITPIGGVAFILGWVFLVLALLRR